MAALSLHQDGERVFASGHQLCELLSDTEATDVSAAALGALRIISPSFRACDYDAWLAKLTIGAGHWTSRPQAAALAVCIDVAAGMTTRITPRPDRYFGLPMGQLTDGQWLAYRAARQAIDKHD